MLNNLIKQLQQHKDLSEQQMHGVMQTLMSSDCDANFTKQFLQALSNKGESLTELYAAVIVMRQFAKTIDITSEEAIDIVGTGGDSFSIFNLSTTCCFVAAAAGATVIKHGGRSVSSKTGAADVLECAGVNLNASAEQINAQVEQFHLGFLFASNYHPAIAKMATIRKTLGKRTIFNLLGPLLNPARVKRHLIGVYDYKWLVPFAQVLQRLGSHKALIVYGEDGMDELTLHGKTFVAELNQGNIKTYTLIPEDVGLSQQSISSLRVKTPLESLSWIRSVLAAEPGPAFDLVCLNTGAALYVADQVDSIQAGVHLAQNTLNSGKAEKLFHAFVSNSNQIIK